MKTALCFFALLTAASLLSGCQDDRSNRLEQRVTQLEQSVGKLQADLKKTTDDERTRLALLAQCVADANAAYERGLANNGSKGRGEIYSVPVTLLAEIRKQRLDKVEECKLLYQK